MKSFISRYFVVPIGTGLLIILISGLLYFAVVAAGAVEFSNDSNAWANFGSYFGGFAGTLLSFVALVLISYALYLQTTELNETREANKKQAEFLEQQMALLQREQYRITAEKYAEVARSTVERKLSASVYGFEEKNLQEILYELYQRALIQELAKKPMSLAELVRSIEIGGQAFVVDPKSIEPTIYSKELALFRIPLLAGALEDYRRAQQKVSDLDAATSEEDRKSYVYNQISPYRWIAQQLYGLGAMDDQARMNWRLDDFMTKRGVLTRC